MPLLVLLFIALPILELLVIIEIAQGIGVAPTLALLLATAIAGAILVRSQGRMAWRRFNEALGTGRVPARETADGAMVIVGGALLVTPGFVTDIVGLGLLLPPGRALVRRGLGTMARRRFTFAWGARVPPSDRTQPWGPRPGDRDFDYEGTAREVGDPEVELPPANGDRRDG